MIKTFLAIIGAIALVGAGVLVGYFQPWNTADVVNTEKSAVAPSVDFETLREGGITVERAVIDASKPKAILYISFSKFFKSPVLLCAFDAKGKEIGRTRRTISGDREDAGYSDFEFDARVPLGSTAFLILTKSQIETPEDVAPVVIDSTSPEASPAPAPSAETPAPAAKSASK